MENRISWPMVTMRRVWSAAFSKPSGGDLYSFGFKRGPIIDPHASPRPRASRVDKHGCSDQVDPPSEPGPHYPSSATLGPGQTSALSAILLTWRGAHQRRVQQFASRTGGQRWPQPASPQSAQWVYAARTRIYTAIKALRSK